MGFKDDLDEDLGAMLTDDEFGYEVTYTKATGGTCNGIFDNEHITVEVGEEGAPVSEQKPTVLIRASDLDSDPAQGDSLTINGNTYSVFDIQPDGTGAILLILEEA